MGEVTLGPLDGRRSFVALADVADQFAGEIVDPGEDTAGNDVALDFAEPDFDLVKPPGIGRREVQVHLGVVGQELRDPLGLMRREIVD